MKITSAKYLVTGEVVVQSDKGTTTFAVIRKQLKKWVEAGNTISPYVDERTREEKRLVAYQEAMSNPHTMMEALWEKVMEDRSDKANALQVKRQKVKTDIP